MHFKTLMRLQKVVAVLIAILWASESLAHGDMHHRINDLTRQLSKSSKDTTLLLERGRLYLDARHPQEAIADFTHVLKLAPQDYGVYFYLAQANLAVKKNNAALLALDTFMQHQNQDAPRARGLALRGDIYHASGKFADAALAYTESLQYKKSSALPDDYIHLANTYLAADKNNTVKATAVIDEGIQHLGNLHALEQRALAIELEANQPQAALQRINRLLAQSPTPHLLMQKGKMLKNMGDMEQAMTTFAAAITSIEQMPAARSNTPAMQTLRKEITQQMTPTANK